MDLLLQNKIALVVGGSKGIGKGIALALAKEDCGVIIASSNPENLKKAKAEIKRSSKNEVGAYVMDVGSPESIRNVSTDILNAYKHIDILITNSPGPMPASAIDLDEDILMNALRANLISVITLCKVFLPSMRKNKFGRVINLTSSTAKEPDEGMVFSSVARAGVLAYAKTLSREVARYGITVNSILTGGVLTDRTRSLFESEVEKLRVTYKEYLAKVSGEIPVGYIATPEQFSHLITFLASPLSMYITGASIPIDGGLMKSI